MEYIIFISTLAAACLVVLIVKKVVDTLSHRDHAGFSRIEPAPPRKRTISGQMKTELEEDRFKARLDAWQTRFHTRRKKVQIQMGG